MLLVLDDLQRASEPTFLMLRHIVRSTVPARLLVVGVYRCQPERAALSGALVDLRRDALPLEIALPQGHHDSPGEPARTVPARIVGERTPFVGRAAERSVLQAAIRKARSGAGGLVLIGGEPGIGKTRLAEEAAAEATRAGMAVFFGHHYEREGASPYIAFVEVLEAGGAQRVDLFAALARAHRGSGDPERAALAWECMRDEAAALGDLVSVARAASEAWFDLFHGGRSSEAHAALARGLADLGDSVPAERACLLSRLGLSLTLAGDPVAGDTHYTAARDLADNVGDPQLTGIVDSDRTQACFATMRMAEGTTIGLRGAQSLRAAGEAWGTVEVLWPVAGNLVWLGRFSESRAVLDEIVPVARRLGHTVVLNAEHKIRGPVAFFESGDLAALFDSAQADLAYGDAYLRGTWNFLSFAWQGVSLFLQGRWDEAEPYFRRGAETAHGAFGGWGRAAWFSCLAATGRRAEAMAVFEEHREDLPIPGQPATTGEWALLFAFTEGLFLLGEREHPAAWHPLIVEAINETGTIVTGFAPGRLLERVAGIAATAGGDHDVAEAHFLAALRQADDLPCQFERLETRRFFAQLLSERAGTGDLDRARRLLTEAVAGYTRFGMPAHSRRARDALAALGR